jgi:hypothetical protein
MMTGYKWDPKYKWIAIGWFCEMCNAFVLEAWWKARTDKVIEKTQSELDKKG